MEALLPTLSVCIWTTLEVPEMAGLWTSEMETGAGCAQQQSHKLHTCNQPAPCPQIWRTSPDTFSVGFMEHFNKKVIKVWREGDTFIKALTTCIYHQLLLMSLDDVSLKHKDYPTNMYD